MKRSNKRQINGIILLDKESGSSSNDALQRVRRLLNAQKAGHGGTLDPFATGILPLLFGEAGKFARFALEADKTYEVCIQFGTQTDSDDASGKIIKKTAIPDLQSVDWAAVTQQFIGVIWQQPPQFSALKINGKRAYQLARDGAQFNIAKRQIKVNSFDCVKVAASSANFVIHCGKGTYIRALARDLGTALQSSAHAKTLRRIKFGAWQQPLWQWQQLRHLADIGDWHALDNLLLPIENMLEHLPKITIANDKKRFLCAGNDVEIATQINGCCTIFAKDCFLGVGECRAGRVYPKRLLQYQSS